MIVNAYKIRLNENKRKETQSKSKYEIVKEVSGKLIKEEQVLIEGDLKDKLAAKVVSILYNEYHINQEEDIKSITQEILNKIFGYGILQKHIDNEYISDIRVANYKDIYVKEKGKWKKVKDSFESIEILEEYIRFCAMKNNANINFETPIVIFSDRKNSLRIEAGIEPVNVTSPSLVIRIHRKNIPSSLEMLFAEYNMLDKKSYQIIKSNIDSSQSVLLSGKGGSGKTTLLKALIERIPKEVAITTNEETAELYLENRNVIQRECILNRNEGKNVDLEMLSKHSLVMSNDVIIVGELKGKEASSFFDSISTGHTGLATIHADSAKNTIDRVITLIKKDIKAQYYTEDFLRRFLASSIDYIIYMKDFKINEITKIMYDDKLNKVLYKPLYKLGNI